MPRAVRPLMLASLLLLVSAVAVAVVRVGADRPGQEASEPASDGVALPPASDDPDDGSEDPVDDDTSPLAPDDGDETTVREADTDDPDGGTDADSSDGGVATNAGSAGSLPDTGTGGLTTVVGVAAMAAAASRRPRLS